jgi:hypothetical protein
MVVYCISSTELFGEDVRNHVILGITRNVLNAGNDFSTLAR